MKSTLKLLAAFALVWMLGACSKEKKEDQATPTAKAGSVQFDFNGKTVAFDGKLIDLLGSKISIEERNDTLVDFGFDIGTKFEKKTYPIVDGSLSSTSSRLSFTDRKTGAYYKAISGTLTITNTDNSKLTGTFSGTFKNQSNNQTLDFTNGIIQEVGY